MDKKIKTLTKEDLKGFKRGFLEEFTFSLMQQLEQMNRQMEQLTDQINTLNREKYGRRSERLDKVTPGQLELCFNESEVTIAEASCGQPEEPTVSDVNPNNTDISPKKRKEHPKQSREDIIKALPEEEVPYELKGSELTDECGGTFRDIGSEVIQRLDFTPAAFKVINQRVYSYKCDNCGKIVRADHPLPVFEGSLASSSLLAGIATAKFTNALTYYRLESTFADAGAFLSRQTMARWMIRAAEEYFSLLYDRFIEELLRCPVIHADETTVEVKKDGRKPGSKSYMWVYTKESSERPVVIYEYQKTRASEHPKEFLKDYSGFLCCDGYEGYHSLNSSITICGCWTHARRHYSNAVKGLKNKPERKGEYLVSEKALEMIADMFHTDNRWKGLSREERHHNRNTILKEKIDAYYNWINKVISTVPPKSETGKGLYYSLNQKKYLLGFLSDPDVPLDNSEAERKIRNFVISRKNFVLIDTMEGARASAIMFSMSETVKANKLKPYEYFEYVLSEMPKHMRGSSKDMHFLDDLMPWSDKLPERIHKVEK